MGDTYNLIPGTAATRGCRPFVGYVPERSSQVICRGNLNVAQHRLCDTMSAFMRLQEDVRRGAKSGEVTDARSKSEAAL